MNKQILEYYGIYKTRKISEKEKKEYLKLKKEIEKLIDVKIEKMYLINKNAWGEEQISKNEFYIALDKRYKDMEEEFEKILESNEEDSEKILQLISNIENKEIQSHVSEILVTDYEISSVEKCIEDVINIYNKERLTNRKLEIIKLLENVDSNSKEEVAKLEQELNEVIIELAKRK